MLGPPAAVEPVEPVGLVGLVDELDDGAMVDSDVREPAPPHPARRARSATAVTVLDTAVRTMLHLVPTRRPVLATDPNADTHRMHRRCERR